MPSWKRPFAAFAIGSGALAAVTILGLKLSIHYGAAAFLYAGIVLLVTVRGGFLAALPLAPAVVFLLDYFFTSRTVPRAEHLGRDALALVVLIGTAGLLNMLIAKIRAREHYLQRVLDGIPAIIGIHNKGVLKMFGGSVPGYREYLWDNLREYGNRLSNMHPDDVPVADEARKRLAAGEPFAYEYRLQSKDGAYRWFLTRAVPIRDDNGRITEWISTAVDIDDLKRAKESLQEKARLLDLSHDAIWVRDLDDRIIYWNRSAEEMTGWTGDEIVGKKFNEVMHPKYGRPFDEIKAEALRTGKCEGEASATTKDGREFTVSVRWSAQTNVKGEPIGFLISGTDITERKRVETELRSAASLLNLTHDAILVFDASGTIRYWNRGAEELYGYTQQEAIGNPAHAFLKTEFQKPLPEIEEQLQRDGRWDGEVVQTRRDGIQVIVASRWSLRRDALGNPLEVMESNNNITLRKLAEEQWKATFEFNPTMYFMVEPSGNVSLVNAFGAAQLGYVTEELVGQSVLNVFYPPDREFIKEKAEECLQHPGSTFQWEARMMRKDGAMLWVRETANAVLINRRLVLLVVCEDITEKKRAEKQIKALHEQIYRENIALREEIDRTSMFEEIVGSSKTLSKVLNAISKVAPSDSTVLITGETGTGKELIARAIHKHSRRSARALVSVNCAAIPQTLISSELFGHERGAFTGATQRRLGRFELANGGTIFLDEVGDLPPETQVALLRVLQEHEFERVGSTQRVRVDVRLLAATNRDLKAAVESGAFRRDLYYRLNVFPIEIPPLRERLEDLPLLVEYFIQRYASKEGKRIRNIDKKTLTMFQEYEWPGNIRELQNVVERGVILCDGDTFRVDDSWLVTETQPSAADFVALPTAIDGHERDMIVDALKVARGRVSGPAGAAARLGIPRSTLESKIRTLGIDKHHFRSPRA